MVDALRDWQGQFHTQGLHWVDRDGEEDFYRAVLAKSQRHGRVRQSKVTICRTSVGARTRLLPPSCNAAACEKLFCFGMNQMAASFRLS